MKYLLAVLLLTITVLQSPGQTLQKSLECVIVNGELKQVTYNYNRATGDRTITVNGAEKNFYDTYPKNGPGYSEGQSWYINNETVIINNRKYVKYGLPRILGTTDIVKSTVYKGVGVYVEAGIKGPAEVIYIPVRQGCEFQPYQFQCGTVGVAVLSSTPTTMQLKVNLSGFTGKLTYNWSSEDVKILEGQNAAVVTVDTKAYTGNYINMRLTVNDDKGCRVSAYEGVSVKR